MLVSRLVSIKHNPQSDGSSSSGGVLAEIRYGIDDAATSADHLIIDVPIRQLGPLYTELWLSEEKVHTGKSEHVRFAYDQRFMLGEIRSAKQFMCDDFEEEIAFSYQQITECVQAHGFPHLHRIWNYLPNIHQPLGDLDRYQLFCRGRHEPLFSHCQHVGDHFPAATAIGTTAAESVIFFLASRSSARHLENPRQVSAFEYPKRYGPQSPSFSRASLSDVGDGKALLISGTASIVGHESQRTDDLAGQYDEALTNIDRLIQAVEQDAHPGLRGIADLSVVKIYLRDATDLSALQEKITGTLARGVPTMIMQGELCRPELMLEIEGVAIAHSLA